MRKQLLFALVLAGASTSLAFAQEEDSDVTPQSAAHSVAVESALTPVSAESTSQNLSSLQDALAERNAMVYALGEAIAAVPSDAQTSAASSATCGTGKASLTDGWQVFAYSLDRNAAIALDLWASAELSATDKVVLYHFTWYKDVVDSDDEIISRCGSGVQLALKASNLSGTAQITLPALAASTQLGMSSVEYRLATFGLSGKAIDDAAPRSGSIGKFDAQAYAELMSSIDKVQAAGAAGGSDVVFTPRVIAMPNEGESTKPVRQLLIQVAALRHIARGSSCSVARESIPDRTGETDAFVNQFYRSFTRPKVCAVLGGGVRDEEQRLAAAELARFGIPAN